MPVITAAADQSKAASIVIDSVLLYYRLLQKNARYTAAAEKCPLLRLLQINRKPPDYRLGGGICRTCRTPRGFSEGTHRACADGCPSTRDDPKGRPRLVRRVSLYLSIYQSSITVHSKYTGTGKQQAKLDRNALRTARVAIQRALPPPRRRTTRELVRHARVELAVHRREGDRRGDCYGGDWRS